MVTVGDRIQSVIEHMDKGRTELALSDVCIAVDITAQKYYGETKSSASCYKRFLQENMWMIIATGMGNMIAQSLKIKFSHEDIKSDEQGYCTIEQIVYHVMRCGLIHGTGEGNKINWNPKLSLVVDADGVLQISPSFIWGLALSVITCEINKDELVGKTCWISAVGFKYLINDLWGKRESVKNMILSNYGVKIEECTERE